MAAVAVYEVLVDLFSLKPDIKWSNDVLVNRKKISGILAEATDTRDGLAVVLGIGVNLTSKNFPSEIESIATSIAQETGRIPDYDQLIENLTRFIVYFYTILEGENGASEIRKMWSIRSSYSEGKRVTALIDGKKLFGTTEGIEKNGALRLKLDSRETIIIHTGEIETLREDL